MAHANNTKAPSNGELALQSNRPSHEPTYRLSGALSSREMDVLMWLARGKSGMEVALILDISVYTVRAHIRSMIRKLNASNIPHAVAQAFTLGVLTGHISN